MAVNDKVLCLAWVDNNIVQFMTTGVSQSDLETQKHWIHPKKRAGIPEGSIQEVPGPGKHPSMAAHTIAYATAGFQASEVEKPRVP